MGIIGRHRGDEKEKETELEVGSGGLLRGAEACEVGVEGDDGGKGIAGDVA